MVVGFVDSMVVGGLVAFEECIGDGGEFLGFLLVGLGSLSGMRDSRYGDMLG